LDIVVPEKEIRAPKPAEIQINNNKPAPKKKSEKEIADEAFIKKHNE